MTRKPYQRAQNAFLAAVVALAILVLLAMPASAAAYTCTWSVNYGTRPVTAIMRCTNGFARAYQQVKRGNAYYWVPVATVPAK